MNKIGEYFYFESKQELMEYIDKFIGDKFIGDKMIGNIQFKADKLLIKPKPDDKALSWRKTGITHITIEIIGPYEDK